MKIYMIVYMVERYGIHQQGVFGLYNTYLQAFHAASVAKKEERDTYHSFYISTWELNKLGYEPLGSTCVFDGTL